MRKLIYLIVMYTNPNVEEKMVLFNAQYGPIKLLVYLQVLPYCYGIHEYLLHILGTTEGYR